jgi:hypothetical protein
VLKRDRCNHGAVARRSLDGGAYLARVEKYFGEAPVLTEAEAGGVVKPVRLEIQQFMAAAVRQSIVRHGRSVCQSG